MDITITDKAIVPDGECVRFSGDIEETVRALDRYGDSQISVTFDIKDQTTVNSLISKISIHRASSNQVQTAKAIIVNDIRNRQVCHSTLDNSIGQGACILVAGGPSVDRQIEVLQNTTLPIIACAQAFNLLDYRGIAVAAIAMIDCNYNNLKHMNPMMSKAPLIVSSGADHASVVSIDTDVYMTPQVSRMGITTTNTVAGYMMTLATQLGFTKAYLVGYDNCVSGGGHCSGYTGPADIRTDIEVRNYSGEVVMTNNIMLTFAVQESAIASISNVEFVNIDPSVAKVDGIRHAKIQENDCGSIRLRPTDPIPSLGLRHLMRTRDCAIFDIYPFNKMWTWCKNDSKVFWSHISDILGRI